MSKERLEELKEILLQAIGSHQSLDHKLHLMEDVQNVFKQAERVEELENEYKVKRTELLEEHIDRLQNRVDELERLEKSFDELDSDYIDTKKENEALAETRRLDAVENVRLWEENQRYKQALEEIVEYNTSKFPHASVSYLENIAKQALAGDTE